ncbi:MAG: hypothetical protein ACI4RC_06930 [Oscillospiraceae bacterium]
MMKILYSIITVVIVIALAGTIVNVVRFIKIAGNKDNKSPEELQKAIKKQAVTMYVYFGVIALLIVLLAVIKTLLK